MSSSLREKRSIFTISSDELEGILSPHFFITKPVSSKGYKELREVASVNPLRAKPVFGEEDMVPYVGLPETGDHKIREVWMRPYKDVKGRNIIKKGDILFARIEPSVFNKKYIYVDDLKGKEYAFTSTEFYIVEAKNIINPLFLFHTFFMNQVYKQVIGKTTGSTGRRRLDKGVFEKIFIPYPSRQIQNKAVSFLQLAYEKKRKKEGENVTTLDSIDGYVLSELGIVSPKEKAPGAVIETYAVSSTEITGRIDPIYFHPSRLKAMAAIKESGVPFKKLSEVVNFRRELVNKIPDGAPYLGLENIVSNTGEYIKTVEKQSVSSAFRFKKGDVLFPKLRPYLNKIFYADFDGICSTEFHVLNAQSCNPFYLYAFLSRSIVVQQTSRLITGNTLPRLQTDDIEHLLIPLPGEDTQEKIADHVKALYKRIESLKIESKVLLSRAQKHAEDVIFSS